MMQSLRTQVGSELFLGVIEIALYFLQLMLKDRDETHTAVDWVPKTSVGFIG